jgi:hypothetical protein
MDFYQQMLCDTRKGVVYGTRLSESGFAIANPYLSQVLRLFVGTPTKREAKTLIRILRIPAQSAETAVSAGCAGAERHRTFFTMHIDYTSAFSKSGGFGQRPTTIIKTLQKPWVLMVC